MSDFETEFDLTLNLPQRELDNVAQQIDDTVGVTEIGLTDGGSMSAQTAGGGGGRARRRARQSFRMERTRTDLLEESVTYLEDIEDHLAEGVGGGGGGVVDDMIGAVVETGGDAAIEGGGLLADLGIESVGTAVGTAVSNAISGSSLNVEQPGWTPIEVEEVEPLDVEQPPAAGFESSPGPVGFKELPGPVGFEELPGPVGVEDPSPLAVEDVEPLQVEEVGPIEVVVTGGQGARSRGGDGRLTRNTGGSAPRDDGGPPSMVDLMSEGMARGGTFGALVGASGYAARKIEPGLEAGPIYEGDESSPAELMFDTDLPDRQQVSQPQQPRQPQPAAPTVNVDVSVGSTRVTVDTTVDSLVDEVMAEVESEYDGQLDEIEADLQEALSDIDNLQSALRGRR